VQVIPSIDLEGGRSRLVFWPGAATGSGAPTDRPERIARHFVALGAPLIHLVDLDGAKAGQPVNLGPIQAIARETAIPLQLAGGIDGPEQVRLAFAAGATRVVMPLSPVIESPEALRDCLAIAGDWLALGIDARAERLREYPWRGRTPPSLLELVGELVDAGVHRFVLSHGGAEPDVALLAGLVAANGASAELLVAGGITDVNIMARLRDAGVSGVILGQALISGLVDYPAAAAAAA
jgi:phosphoribosylformimino-5-aminoimidazole carboxamide ribotide isomerase